MGCVTSTVKCWKHQLNICLLTSSADFSGGTFLTCIWRCSLVLWQWAPLGCWCKMEIQSFKTMWSWKHTEGTFQLDCSVNWMTSKMTEKVNAGCGTATSSNPLSLLPHAPFYNLLRHWLASRQLTASKGKVPKNSTNKNNLSTSDKHTLWYIICNLMKMIIFYLLLSETGAGHFGKCRLMCS